MEKGHSGFVLASTLTVSTALAVSINKMNPEKCYVGVQLLGINDFHGQLTTTKETGRKSR